MRGRGGPAVKVHYDHLDFDFLRARPLVLGVMDDVALDRADAWAAAWDDLFDCWCGCPL